MVCFAYMEVTHATYDRRTLNMMKNYRITYYKCRRL